MGAVGLRKTVRTFVVQKLLAFVSFHHSCTTPHWSKSRCMASQFIACLLLACSFCFCPCKHAISLPYASTAVVILALAPALHTIFMDADSAVSLPHKFTPYTLHALPYTPILLTHTSIRHVAPHHMLLKQSHGNHETTL